MSPQSNDNNNFKKNSLWSTVNLKITRYLDELKLEPAIWSRDTGQQIPCFKRWLL